MKISFFVKPIHEKVLRGPKLVLPIKLAFVSEGGFKKNSQLSIIDLGVQKKY